MSPEVGGGESVVPADEPAAEAPPLDCETKSGAGSGDTESAPVVESQAVTPPPPAAPPIPPLVDVDDLDWDSIGASLEPDALRARMRGTVEKLEALLDSTNGVQMLFDDKRERASDRALQLTQISDEPLWFIGDMHGDLLTLDAALALIRREAARVVFPRRTARGAWWISARGSACASRRDPRLERSSVPERFRVEPRASASPQETAEPDVARQPVRV